MNTSHQNKVAGASGATLFSTRRVVGLCSALIFSCASSPAREAPPERSVKPVAALVPARDDRPKVLAKITFAATGDMMNHISVSQSAAAANVKDDKGNSTNHGGYDALFGGVVPDIAAADFAFANLETPISPKNLKKVVEFVFNSPPDLVEALKTTGFDVVSFANNHVYDQGRAGFVDSLDELEKAKLPFVGAGRTRALAHQGIRFEKDGVKFAFLGASQFFNSKDQNVDDPKQPHCNKTDDPEAMEEAVKEARKEADFVLVSLHWGVEYTAKPRDSEIELAHRLFEAGADVVLGHHPHVLQPIEVYQAKDGRFCMVVYSMGNFISNQSRQYAHKVSPEKVGDARDGVLVRFAVERKDYGSGVVRAELADLNYLPLWTENDYLTRKDKAPPVIRVVVVGREITRAQEALDAIAAEVKEGKPSKPQQAEIVRLKKRIELMERRREIAASRLGEEFLADPPALGALLSSPGP